MASFCEGEIVSLETDGDAIVHAVVDLGTTTIPAVGYPHMLGPLREGSRVVVNTTGIELELGTGGTGFILWNLDEPPGPGAGAGHIMKLRYTPWQMNVMSVESPESPHHDPLLEPSDLGGAPVVVCALHSQVAAAAAAMKVEIPDARIGYLMTDGGALPLAFSRLVGTLRREGLIEATCTTGHAFGGDLEAVNVFSGLAALKTISACDAVVVAVGPGIVGTGTALGHSGLEQGQALDAVTALGGTAIAALRISFSDARARHHGVSHHSMSALTIAARERALVVIPKLSPKKARQIERQLAGSQLCERHEVILADGRPGVHALLDRGIDPTSMGRPMSESPEQFLAAAAAGAVAGKRLEARR